MNGWRVEHWQGTAADFHEFVPPPRRSLWVVDLSEPALVLGSTQSIDTIDTGRASSMGFTLARRHSGGGAVWLHPGQSVWIDVTIPRDDPLWVEDVPSSMGWLGAVLRDALHGVQPAEVAHDPYVATPLARAVCFGGLAPGEVVTDGAKTIGISQRRTRDGARFQCVGYTTWDVEQWVDVMSDESIRNATRGLRVATIGTDAHDFVRSVTACLPG